MVAIVGGAAYAIYFVFEAAVLGIVSIFKEEKAPDEDKVIVRRRVTTRKLSPSVILFRASGPGALPLGPQPLEGYRLEASIVERLGGPGSRVRVVDGALETEATLGPSR